MVYFGEFGDEHVRVALVRIAQSPSALAREFLINATKDLKPKVVLFVGICGTVNQKRAKLGDVLIPAKLASPTIKKITADGTLIHSDINVSGNIAPLILSAADGWQPPLLLKEPSSLDVKIHRQAVILSGLEYVSTQDRMRQILNIFPDAIFGGKHVGLVTRSLIGSYLYSFIATHRKY
jgi:nucleoside phosphorylase